MRETRPSGSEGGATEINRSFLPLSYLQSLTVLLLLRFGPLLLGEALRD